MVLPSENSNTGGAPVTLAPVNKITVPTDLLRTSVQAAEDRLKTIQGTVSAAIYNGSADNGQSTGMNNVIHTVQDAYTLANNALTKPGALYPVADNFFKTAPVLDQVYAAGQNTSAALNASAEGYREWADELKGTPQKIIDSFTNPIKQGTDGFKDTVSDATDDIKDTVDKTVKSLTDTAKMGIAAVCVIILVIAAVVLMKPGKSKRR